MCMNQIAKVDCNAFLSESESTNLSLLYHFGGDSTLVLWIANVRDWSRHRFRQRLQSVCIRRNQNDFHQFSWSLAFSDIIFLSKSNLFTPMADFLFWTLKSWFYSCLQPANLTDIHFHSFWQAPKPQRHKKNPYHCFHWSKYLLQLVIGQMLISH